MATDSPELVLRKIATLIAQRGFRHDQDWDDTILDVIGKLVAPYAGDVDVF